MYMEARFYTATLLDRQDRYIYYEDDLLLGERHIYAEKAVVESSVMRDLIFSETAFFVRLILYIRSVEYREAVESVQSEQTDVFTYIVKGLHS